MIKIIFIIFFVIGFAGGYFSLQYFSEREVHEGEVLSKQNEVKEETEIPTITPSSSPSPTLTPTPSITPTPLPTNTPTPTPLPEPSATSEQINGYIERFAGQYAVDSNVLRHIAMCESGFNPSAVNSIYVGLYQFGPITWENNRLLMGENPDIDLRFSAEESVQTAAYLISIGRGGVWPNCYP